MENDKTINFPPKTVIFRHPAAVFNLDENIKRNTVFINEQNPDDKESLGNYFLAIINAGDSEKQYVVIDYNQEIVHFLHLVLTYSYSYRFTNWSFIAFFHDDEASGTKQTSQIISDDLKHSVLMNMFQFGYIAKHTITPDYTVTEQDIKALNDFWKEQKNNYIKKRSTNKRKPPLPLYDCLLALQKIESRNEEKRISA